MYVAGSITAVFELPLLDELELVEDEDEEVELEEDDVLELELLEELVLLEELLDEEVELEDSSAPQALSRAAALTSIKLLIIRRLKQRKGVLSNMLFSTHCNYWRSSI